jgi:hypothetical protein
LGFVQSFVWNAPSSSPLGTMAPTVQLSPESTSMSSDWKTSTHSHQLAPPSTNALAE